MKKFILLMLLSATSSAGVIGTLLGNEEYTYEALGAMVYYHVNCTGISDKGRKFAKDAIELYYIDASTIHVNNDRYIKGWHKAEETSECQEIYNEFKNYWLNDLLNDPLQETDI